MTSGVVSVRRYDAAGRMRDAFAEKEKELEAERTAHMDALGARRPDFNASREFV